MHIDKTLHPPGLLLNLISNSISIFITLATMLYIFEQLMKGRNLLKTQNRKLIFALIFISFSLSITNLTYVTSAASCKVIRFAY